MDDSGALTTGRRLPLPVMNRVTDLGVLTFNIWRDGGRSLERTISAIRLSLADLIGLQECDTRSAKTIAAVHALDDARRAK
jgi:hypothetical protein